MTRRTEMLKGLQGIVTAITRKRAAVLPWAVAVVVTGSLVATREAAAADPVTATLEGVLLEPTGGGAHLFGIRAAVDGDTAVLSPLLSSPSATGSADVFVRNSDGTWSHQTRLLHPSPAPGDQFGSAVAIDGDTIVIGVFGDDLPTGPHVGSAQVYVRTGTTWAHQAELLHPDVPGSFGIDTDFGAALAVRGDTIVVGAPRDHVTGFDQNGTLTADGSVQVYRRSGTTWAHVTELVNPEVVTNPAAARGDQFGQAVALDESTVVVGQPRDDTKGLDAGTAHTFAVGSWAHLSTLSAPDGAAFDQFGASVAVSGGTVLVGSVFDATPAGGAAGSVHVFVDGAYEAKLLHPAGAAGDQFGTSVAIAGDLAIVGAPGDDIPGAFGGVDGGSAHVFVRHDGAWTAELELRHPFDVGGLAGDQFGRVVALDGVTLVVSAPFDNNPNGSDAGAAFVNGLVLPPTATNPVAQAGSDQTVAEGADVTLDGSASTDPNGDPLSYHWEQVGGPTVTLSDPSAAQPGFTAPSVPSGGATLTFRLVVDDGTHASEPDNVDITVKNENKPPVADAGDDQVTQEGSAVTLHGGDSFDPDSEPLSYLWTQTAGPEVALSNPAAAEPTFAAPLVGAAGETLAFALTVSDGIDVSTDTVLIAVTNVNHAPTADAGPDQTIGEGNPVTLTGTASSDPDADPLTYAWTQLSGPAVALSDPLGAMPTFTAPLVGPGGEAVVFELRVSDSSAASQPDSVTINVLDTNQPPACELARASLALLWPPNHKLVEVGILGVADPEDQDVQITTTAVTQDEPVNGQGDGDTSPDAVLQGASVLIRAERAGNGTGRVYAVAFTAEDASGAVCTGSVAVCVPHDRRDACLDEGQAYDSLLP